MDKDQTPPSVPDWRTELPVLTGRTVTLREPHLRDLGPLMDLLALSDASRFGLDEPVSELSARELIDRAARDRSAGVAVTYAITLTGSQALVGIAHVRQLEPTFETAEWDATIAPSMRGSGIFIEAVRLVGSFVFRTIGAHRIEARVLLQNGRANGALRKLGAVQEGVLRRSVRRGDQHLDQVLWSMLKDDWGDKWVSTSPRVH